MTAKVSGVRKGSSYWTTTYSLSDIINDNGAVGIAIVHGGQRLVPLLAGRIPNLEFDGRVFIEGDGLCQESRADSGFPVRVELVLDGQPSSERREEYCILP